MSIFCVCYFVFVTVLAEYPLYLLYNKAINNPFLIGMGLCSKALDSAASLPPKVECLFILNDESPQANFIVPLPYLLLMVSKACMRGSGIWQRYQAPNKPQFSSMRGKID